MSELCRCTGYVAGASQDLQLPSQCSAAVTHCLLIATHFTDPRKDDSLCQARECHREAQKGECVTTQPPALFPVANLQINELLSGKMEKKMCHLS